MKPIHSDNAPKAIGPYSPAVKAGNVVFFSGQVPLDPKTMALVSTDFREQVVQVFRNLATVCEAAGGKLSDLCKITIYLIDLGNFAIVNEVMETFFQPPYPARTTIQVSALPKNAKIEIDAFMIQ